MGRESDGRSRRGERKKLIGAVEHLLEGDHGPDDRLQAEAAALGVILPEAPEPEAYELWAENVPVVELFIDVQTQWRPGAGGGVLGLDYNVVFRVMELNGVVQSEQKELLRDLQVMEAKAMQILNAKLQD